MDNPVPVIPKPKSTKKGSTLPMLFAASLLVGYVMFSFRHYLLGDMFGLRQKFQSEEDIRGKKAFKEFILSLKPEFLWPYLIDMSREINDSRQLCLLYVNRMLLQASLQQVI
ncbi:uncharacterized protein LOC105698605 [Orussus abietinus]|uniref:uncharacterized protein LOC105698605 n=1 Tax=Orussus abietinus TaxID=222816 RepID=UPI000625AB24|nr:uncharacterized protein LOC105698605 [Orussus abietinus]